MYFVRASGVQAAVSGGGLHDKLSRGVALPADPDNVPLGVDFLALLDRGGGVRASGWRWLRTGRGAGPIARIDLDGCAASSQWRKGLCRPFGKSFGARGIYGGAKLGTLSGRGLRSAILALRHCFCLS